ncbi:TIGR02678 family protein [Nocardia sp. NPDC056100]|uniref:TIGR02678 family protein n=1 Tax=Nocardia sp. NPDC056100 TaxID=3345712 RepID=UPI0035D65227
MHARTIDSLALDNYQRAARVVLANHLITRSYPDRIALPLIRRWATELREDLAELFGYRLEVTESTARLFPVLDSLDAGRPARTAADRLFDRRRYAYLALALAALGRAGDQITLSELADQVASYTERVDGLDLAADRAGDRDAFVDAVGWLAARGAVTLADGDAGGWASDPEAGEALYDIDRSVVFALFRPPRALQHLQSVTGLLGEEAGGGDTRSPAMALASRAVRRALVEQPVVYADDLAEPHRSLLAQEKLVHEVELVTGLKAERRAEGVALIDSSGRLSDVRFPGTGTLAQVALLLAGEIADLVLDLDNPVARIPRPERPRADLADQLDTAIPVTTVFAPLADTVDIFAAEQDSDDEDAEPEIPDYPFIESAWIRDTVRMLTGRYGATFAAQWQADVPGLTVEVVGLLERLRLIERVDTTASGSPAPDDLGSGLLILPALARYRGAIVTIRTRAETELFISPTDVGARPEPGAPVTDPAPAVPDDAAAAEGAERVDPQSAIAPDPAETAADNSELVATEKGSGS